MVSEAREQLGSVKTLDPLGLDTKMLSGAVSSSVRAAVRTIGSQLDVGVFPDVFDGGIVMPRSSASSKPAGKETSNGRPKSSRFSESSPRARPSEPAWASGQTAPIKRPTAQARYQADLGAVREAYPGSRVWNLTNGMWLLSESTVVAGSGKAATFLTGFSWAHSSVRSWGFWREGVVGITWIGPRHTNFPDGSVCAFDPRDSTWKFGDPLVELLDLYTVWAFRHLHLKLFSRWPGAQTAFHPYERRIEFKQDELCGCGSALRYQDCCFGQDQAMDLFAGMRSFNAQFAGGRREPPVSITKAVLHSSEPPDIDTLI